MRIQLNRRFDERIKDVAQKAGLEPNEMMNQFVEICLPAYEELISKRIRAIDLDSGMKSDELIISEPLEERVVLQEVDLPPFQI